MKKVTTVLLFTVIALILAFSGYSAIGTEAKGLLYAFDDYTITLNGSSGLPVTWSLTKDGVDVNLSDFIEGKLNETGNQVRFTQKGQYVLTANVTDAAGRVFTTASGVTVYPVPTLNFSIPDTGYVNVPISVSTNFIDVDSPVSWSLAFNGDTVILANYTTGTLNNGGILTFNQIGNYELTATMTDTTGRAFSNTKSFTIEKELNCDFSLQSYSQHASKIFVVTMDAVANIANKTVVWSLVKGGSAASYTGTLTNNGGSINVDSTGTFTLKAAVTDNSGREVICIKTFTATNTAPNTPVITRTPNGSVVNQFDPVKITATATDPDGESVELVWENRPADNTVYSLGAQTVRVKSRDKWGAESAWATTTFTTAYLEYKEQVVFSYPSTEKTLYSPNDSVFLSARSIEIPAFAKRSGYYYRLTYQSWNNITKTWEKNVTFDLYGDGETPGGGLTDKTYTRVWYKFETNDPLITYLPAIVKMPFYYP